MRGRITEADITKIIAEMINGHYEIWASSEKVALNHSDSYVESLREAYEPFAREQIPNIFESIPLTADQIEQLTKISMYLFYKTPDEIEVSTVSGIVIAGYGDREFSPGLIEYRIEQLVLGRLKYQTIRERYIGNELMGIIVPFAQTEMVGTFMNGIDPSLNHFIGNVIHQLVLELPKYILDEVSGVSKKRKATLVGDFQDKALELTREYLKIIDRKKAEDYSGPITQVVSTLPKEELVLDHGRQADYVERCRDLSNTALYSMSSRSGSFKGS
jgi:hypothetical protein